MVASVLPIGFLGIVLGSDAYAREISEELQFNDAIAAASMGVVDVALGAAADLAEGAAGEADLAAALSGATPDTDALNTTLDGLRDSSPLADSAFIIDAQGTVLAISPTEGLANTTGRNYSSRDYFRGAFGCRCTYVSGSYRGTVVTSPHGAVATVLTSDNRTFLLGIALGTDEITRRVGQVELPHGSWTVITDQYGIVVSHPSQSLVENLTDLSGEEWFQGAVAAGSVRMANAESYDGNAAVVSAVRSELSGWLVAVVTPTMSLTDSANEVVLPIVIQTGVAAVVAAGIGLYLAGRITRPVMELAEAARVVEKGGDLKMEADGSKEMDDLKDSITSMANTLTARLRENEELVNHLERDQQIREQLLDIISHELRTPVTVIQGYGELLTSQDATLPPARREAALAAMRQASQALGYLIQSMVVISRYRSGRERLHLQRFPAGEVLQEAADLARMRRPGRGGETQITVDPENLVLRADRQKALMVFHNLLDNALKFGGGRSPVRVRAFAEDGHVVVSVRDDGPGFPRSVLDRVGHPFVTGDTTDTRLQGGLGLGLMVAIAMAELHGGRLTIDSRPGEGSTVFVSFPQDMRHAK